MTFNKHTENFFLAIYKGDISEVQKLISCSDTDLTCILPNMYISSPVQLKVLVLFNAFGNHKLKQKLSTNNPLLFALSIQQLEIAKIVLEHLLHKFRVVCLKSIQSDKIKNSLLYVNSYGMSVIHLLCACDIEQGQTLLIMLGIFNKLVYANIGFMTTVLKTSNSIFCGCNYHSKYNVFYKQIVYEALKYSNRYEILFNNSKQNYLLFLSCLIKNNNIDLLLFFIEQHKDFCSKELILEAIKLCDKNSFKRIVLANQSLAIGLINKNFDEFFDAMVNSVDECLVDNCYVAIMNIAAKMNLLFKLTTIESSHITKSIENISEAIKKYARYRQYPIKAVNFTSWLRICKNKINTMFIKEKDSIIIYKNLENIYKLLFGVATQLPTTRSEVLSAQIYTEQPSFKLPSVDSNCLFFMQSQSTIKQETKTNSESSSSFYDVKSYKKYKTSL